MHQVIYFSRGGNTRKVAETMARELGIQAADIAEATLDQEGGVIFLGSGCYGGKPSPHMMRFIDANAFRDRQVALFGTSGSGRGVELTAMAEALKGKGAVEQGRFHCKGQFFWIFSRGHPNPEDIDRARSFARETVKKG